MERQLMFNTYLYNLDKNMNIRKLLCYFMNIQL